jgi:hypothetical protein
MLVSPIRDVLISASRPPRRFEAASRHASLPETAEEH